MDNTPARRVPGQRPPTRRARSYIEALHTAVLEEKASLQAIESLTLAGAWTVVQLKKTQTEMELHAPDAAPTLALLFNTSCMAIVKRVALFGDGLS